jgi:hypothetical protein
MEERGNDLEVRNLMGEALIRAIGMIGENGRKGEQLVGFLDLASSIDPWRIFLNSQSISPTLLTSLFPQKHLPSPTFKTHPKSICIDSDSLRATIEKHCQISRT